MTENKRIDNEVKHGKKILHAAEDIWGWGSPAGRVRANRRAAIFVELAKIKKTDKVLEIGCGTGLFTRLVYARTGAEIIATDIVDDLLEKARIECKDARFVREDAMALTCTDKTFDVVFGSSILHHLNIGLAFKEILRVLKPGGRMVFAEPNMLNPQILVQKNVGVIKEAMGDSPDEAAFIRWQVEKVIKNAGFINTKTFPYDFLHPFVPKPLISAVSFLGSIIESMPVFREIAGSVVIYGEKIGD
ncbi:MAG: class I SAM-dependent methyltransferase [Elusimicrobiota bacterium]